MSLFDSILSGAKAFVSTLGQGVQAITNPLPPPPIVQIPKSQQTPNVQAAMKQVAPLIKQAQTSYKAQPLVALKPTINKIVNPPIPKVGPDPNVFRNMLINTLQGVPRAALELSFSKNAMDNAKNPTLGLPTSFQPSTGPEKFLLGNQPITTVGQSPLKQTITDALQSKGINPKLPRIPVT